jgi:hypothetical protein
MASVYLTQFNDGVQSGDEVSAGDYALLTGAADLLARKLASHLANGWGVLEQQADLIRVSKQYGSGRHKERRFQVR